ncbi:MAG: hypothetical protein IJ427_06500 [Lachnospiraceae bacterium]|nr:hypothetical protein [Lachnospiraceae bacterium]
MICKQFVKVLFPFRYEKDGNNNLENVIVVNEKGNEKHLFARVGFEGANLRKGVQGLFSATENVSKIVDCYCLECDARAYIGLPRRKDESMLFHTREKKEGNPYSVAVNEIALYLFESGVGFVEMECGFESQSVSDYISCNYFLTEIKSGANYFVAQKRVWNVEEKREERTETRFTVRELLQKVLEPVSGVKEFYSEKEWGHTQEKGIIYSYLYLEEKTEDFERWIHNIRNNYKETYKVLQRYKSLEEDPNVRQQFENSYWVTSYNGTINVSHKTDNDATNLFFEKDFFSKMHSTYYILFLAVLHQRFALLKAMTESVEISNLNLGYEDTKRQLVQIGDYRLQVHRLKCRAFFEKPSYVQHVNDYYELIETSYCVDELYSDLSMRLEEVEQICDVYVERINAHEERLSKRRNAKVEIFVSVFGTIVGLLTVLNEAWELLEKLFGIPQGTLSVPVLVLALFLWIPSVMVCINVVNKVKEIKEITREIKRETPVPEQKKKGK